MTRFDDTASMGVMLKLGMRVKRSLLAGPPWLQVMDFIESRTI